LQLFRLRNIVWFNDSNSILAPSPGFPRIFSFGTITLVKNISPVGDEFDPNFSKRVVFTPLKFLGSITNAESPLEALEWSV
jgi:hypothetical protein